MKKGHVIDVLTLPDLIPIRTEDQVQALAQSQKVEVLFENEDQVSVYYYCLYYYCLYYYIVYIIIKGNGILFFYMIFIEIN